MELPNSTCQKERQDHTLLCQLLQTKCSDQKGHFDDALDAHAGAKYFTTLDLQSGYHQVAMDSDSIGKTVFISHAGLYEYNVMSFGLTNVPSTFQRLMQHVLHGLDWQICLVYIDDVIIFSSSFEEHLS